MGSYPIRDSKFYSEVAQLAEQVAVNHPVGGSNPSLGAKFLYISQGSSFYDLSVNSCHRVKEYPIRYSSWVSLEAKFQMGL